MRVVYHVNISEYGWTLYAAGIEDVKAVFSAALSPVLQGIDAGKMPRGDHVAEPAMRARVKAL